MTIEKGQHLLIYLGYAPGKADGIMGPVTRDELKKFQKSFGLVMTGEFDSDTQKALKHAVAYDMFAPEKDTSIAEDWWGEIQYFAREEFACKCGRYHAPYCDGYPHEIQKLLVQIADRARKHFGQPIDVVSGLRCDRHNLESDGTINSQHKYGEAADVCVRGVSQKTALDWFLSQKDVRYAYAIENSSNVHFDIQKGKR